MDALSVVGTIVTIVSFLAMILQWLYYNKIKFYVFVNRIVKRMREVTFDVSFTYKVKKDIDVFNNIELSLKEMYKLKNINKEMNLKTHKIYNLDNFLLKVQLDKEVNADEDIDEVFIYIPKLKVTYKSAEDILEEIDKLSQVIKKKMNINEEKYSLDIRYYKNRNPFFGYAIQRFGVKTVKSFVCQLDCNILIDNEQHDLNDKKACIYKEYVNVTDNSFSDLRRVAKYLLILR
ncbi:hypothetical protein [Dehalobacter sp. TeCB1]|uniref:hypothetical protein n=1 Tax=Dehalobacter sp. TeCB1 TaxID=1843715 RepID=UPI00083B4BC4|nr:hypothetical protein [Dehalobacter sp. TeCB1]OCZ50600.1 hypothetical protein A7D23_14590 [Dehalobacter sp. TeCB1]